MKSNVKQFNRKAAFTIVELLTVMSIIVILIGLLVPALNKVRQFAFDVKQQAQFHSIDAALELFVSEFDDYPPSDRLDPDGAYYCGAMKLCEAMMGRDLMGFHSESTFRASGLDASSTGQLYPPQSDPLYQNSLSSRKGPYLPRENANAYQLRDIYEDLGPFGTGEHFVLCDVFRRVTHLQSGQKVGMPILYYKANTAKTLHDFDNPANPLNIYDYTDNDDLVMLGKPFDPPSDGGTPHKLAVETGRPRGYRFYMNTTNDKMLATTTAAVRPYKEDTYILISAGYDGEYGTPDDICNFDWRYRQ
jgi:type II secretory pathway pseudopilin PulG